MTAPGPAISYAKHALMRNMLPQLPNAPREVVMLDALVSMHGEDRCFTAGVCDLSQSIQMCRFRSDGLLCCLSTSSRPFSLSAGRPMTITDMYCLMGFPVGRPLYRREMLQLSGSNLMKLLGNSMCVPVVTYVGLAAMIAANQSGP